MAQSKPERAYYYRGIIERGRKDEWRDAYSEAGSAGGILYPYVTRAEARRYAARDGYRAVFYMAETMNKKGVA